MFFKCQTKSVLYSTKFYKCINYGNFHRMIDPLDKLYIKFKRVWFSSQKRGQFEYWTVDNII